MRQSKMKSANKHSTKPGVKLAHDNDPEALETFAPSSESGSETETRDGAFTGREHYEAVDKSMLRKPSQPTLGKEYEGSTVSRAALNGHDGNEEDPFAPVEEDSDDDPFTKSTTDRNRSDDSEGENGLDLKMSIVEGEIAEDEDEEIDSDAAFGNEDASNFSSFKFRGSKSMRSLKKTASGDSAVPVDSDSDVMDRDTESGDPGGQISEEEDSESDESVNMHGEDHTGTAEDSDVDSASTNSTVPEMLSRPTGISSDRAALKAILANDTAAVASTLSAAVYSDARKGKAVRQQYQTFDRLLDTRIKLQKGLTAANSLTKDSFKDREDELAVQKAEQAALSLWSTIESIQHSLLDAQLASTGSTEKTKKRKRLTPATLETATPDLWLRMQSFEKQLFPHHRAVLDKWSSKARAAAALPPPRSQLIDRSSQNQDSITAILDTYLASESTRLIAQASNPVVNPTHPPSVSQQTYNDTAFYQSLLRDLIASRSSTSAETSSNIAILPSATTRLHPSGSKTKRVDTKASKGRKVRYTVHEKLQNFAAEEERGTWEESARREFFGSLFGRKGALDEDDRRRGVDGEEGGTGAGEGIDDEVVDGEAEALRLFRN